MRRTLVLLIGLLVLAGCAQQAKTTPFTLTGTDGVTLTNVYAPKNVYAGEDFSLSYDLKNAGITNITSDNPGHLIVSWDKLYTIYNGSVSSSGADTFTLRGKDLYEDGQTSYVTLYFTANQLQRNSQQVTTPIMLTVCYPYASDITTQVCIEQTQRVDQGAVACTPAPVHPDSPGAPIGVKDVEVRTQRVQSGNQLLLLPQFRITLTNYDNGIPSIGACDDPNAQLNAALVSATLLNQQLDCGSGLVHFTNGDAFILCSVPPSHPVSRGVGNFISLLSIHASYTYRQSDKTEVTILNNGLQ